MLLESLDSIHTTPINYTFEGQKEEEVLLIFTRQHWWLMLSPVITASLMVTVIPVILIILLAQTLANHPGTSMLFLFGWMIYVMCIWLVVAYKFMMYSLNTWIVTDSRILDIWQKGFFHREVSELHLESIQDISVHTNGIVQSYFNFGNIDIQTAAVAQHFTLEDVPNPIEIKDKVMTAANAYVQKHNMMHVHV